MTVSDSTEFALHALPLLSAPLMDFDCLYHIRCPILQPLMISMPDRQAVFGPEGDLFQYPIQVIPLSLEPDHVKLGLYAHPALKLFRGPQPDAEWLKAWEEAPFNPHHKQSPLPAGGVLAGLYDQFCDLIELHHFFYDAVNALIETEMVEPPPATRAGIWRFSRALREQEEALKQHLHDLCEQARLEQSEEQEEDEPATEDEEEG